MSRTDYALCAKLVPTSWLDPLLTGPEAVIGKPPYNGHDIERLLSAVAARILAAAPKAGVEGIDGPRRGPVADGSQKPNDAAAIPCAKAGSNSTAAYGVGVPFKCAVDGATTLCQSCKPEGRCKSAAGVQPSDEPQGETR